MTASVEYEVFAIKYAVREAMSGEHFIGGDPHEHPMPMDYFVWAVKGGGRTFVVDTGFGKEDAEKRGRTLLRTTGEALALVGVDAATVEDVIITHLHYDHVGGFYEFPKAQFHLQDREMAYATGRNMAHGALNHPFTVDHVAAMVREVYKGRVTFHDGDAELAPGLSIHHVGGHTDGLMFVRVHTKVGWIVLASDASHMYANMNDVRPFPIVYNVGDMVQGYAKMRGRADDPRCIVPGHDPRVFQHYPAVSPDLEGIALRLDVIPTGM